MRTDRTARGLGFLVAVVLCATNVAGAQTTLNPRVVSFVPSADHSALDASGQPLVTSYEFEIFQQGTVQALRVANIGKPDPAADGNIYVDFMSLLGQPPATGVTLEARVAAIGPSGRGESMPSNTFTFDAPAPACTPTVTPTFLSGGAAGGTSSISVSVAAGCVWQVTNGLTWLTVTSGANGSGSGAVSVSMLANQSPTPRTGSFSVAGQTVTVSQDAGIVANAPPSVQVTSPASGSTFTIPASLAITADATDNDGTIARVDFFANGQLVGTRSTGPFSVAWSNVATGTYALTAVATDNIGAQTTSPAVTITVSAPNMPPSVQVTSPVSGATFASPAVIGITALATDSDGKVARVQFYANNALIGTASGTAYSFTWSGVVPGNYTITAKALDDDGAEMTSGSVSVIVKAPNMMPSVQMTSPTGGQNFATSSRIAIAADASDSDGAIAHVEFYANGATIGSAATAPYTALWANMAAGTYTLTAAATDNNGARTMSSGVTVTVTGVNAPPSVTLTSPSSGATFTAPATIGVSANASDGDGSIARVDFLVNGSVAGTRSASPFALSLGNLAAGSYTVRAVAVDNAGAASSSAPVTITVTAAPAPAPDPVPVPPSGEAGPQVSIVSPSDGSTVLAPANLVIDATASDTDGTVSRVEFFVNGALVGWSTAPPYSIRWSTKAAGTYSITARATDTHGLKKTSAAVKVVVQKKGGKR